MDLGISYWVAGAGLNEVQEAPGFRSYLAPTPASPSCLELEVFLEKTIFHSRISAGNSDHDDKAILLAMLCIRPCPFWLSGDKDFD